MNNTVKGLLIFVAGACTGSLVTLFVCRREMRNLVAELEELYEGVEDEPPMPEKAYQLDNKEEVIDYCKSDIENMEIMSGLYGQKQVFGIGDYDGDALELNPKIVDPHPSEKPYIITVEDFNERFDTHEKLELTYYDGDNTLVDEGEELIADYVALIGECALDSFGDGSEDPDIVYVRNEKLGVDYEVTRVAGSYKEMVLNDGGDD